MPFELAIALFCLRCLFDGPRRETTAADPSRSDDAGDELEPTPEEPA